MKEELSVAGIGELLWDIFPTHKRLGGAPTNFAYHTHQLGAAAWPVSSVGDDSLGAELRSELVKLGVNGRYVSQCADYPTGTVDVVLHAGKPTYDIHTNVAWDHIPFTAELEALASQLDAACFGSLSQRSPVTRETIRSFLHSMPQTSVKIFDVNLRQSFFSKELIEQSLKLVNVLKLSDEELPVLRDLFELQGGVAEQIRQLLEMFDLRLIAFTRGPLGSLLLGANEVHDFPGLEAEVIDTVGAGDSFTAALCMGLLRDWPLSDVNHFANKVAAYVCSQKGATPTLPTELIHEKSYT